MKNCFLFLIVWGVLTSGCGIFPKKPDGTPSNYLKKEDKVEQTQKQIEAAEKKIENKGVSFLYGARLTLAQETNKTPHVVVSERFLDLATLSLGTPSISDAKIIDEISKGLIDEFKAKIEQEKSESLKLRIINSNDRKEIESLKLELKLAESSAEKYDKSHKLAEKLLLSTEKNVSDLQEEIIKLGGKHESELKKLQDLNHENAAKAAAWEEDNGFWQQFNIFKDIFSLIKKLAVISLIGGVLFIGFKVLEIFFPAFNILGTVFGGIVKMISKFVPAAKNAAGLVSDAVYSGFKNIVKATENALNIIENHDIESQLLKNYPTDYKFSTQEVKNLLIQHSEQIEKIIKDELKIHTDSDDKGLIHRTKVELNLK